MFTQNLGYPRIGGNRELKKAVESYWGEKISHNDLQQAAQQIRLHNWQLQKDAGIDLIPSNDFSLYDQMLLNNPLKMRRTNTSCSRLTPKTDCDNKGLP